MSYKSIARTLMSERAKRHYNIFCESGKKIISHNENTGIKVVNGANINSWL